MILSFHPLFEADQNKICAGRKPDSDDLSAIKAADAVILPQGCSQSLYEMACKNCPRVFPNYEARFRYPGKIGQTELFRQTKTAHPATEIYRSLESFRRQHGDIANRLPLKPPFVLKLDWGGEGDTVYLITSMTNLENILKQTEILEKSGQTGFLLQQFIPDQNKTLRVAVIGRRFISYWRVRKNGDGFLTNLSKGATIDTESESDLQRLGIESIKAFCKKTGINLAGFDIIFSPKGETVKPLMLEINYFFGRKGLGGSQTYYRILQEEIRRWLKDVGCRI